MIKRISYIATLAALLTLTSCGELFDNDDAIAPVVMTLESHDITLMLGDSCVLRPIFTPDSISNKAVFWLSTDNTVAQFAGNDTIVGVALGSCDAIAIAVTDYRQTDTCHVNVVEPWTFSPYEYFYDMVVYADITVNGEPLTDDMTVAAFANSELRGIGEQRVDHGIAYTYIRLYSYNDYGDVVSFKCYDRRTHHMYDFPASCNIVFDGEVHGTISSLIRMNAE